MSKKYLIAILFIAAILRLWNLGDGDPMGDEADLAFRAIGMLDFDAAAAQTTPLEWFDPAVPSWTRLSFHDHPPLVFLLQHISLKIFGENNFGFRFPSALVGIVSVYLLYLIGRRLFTENVGLLSAALMALTANHVFISRVGLQESYVIFFILLAFYFFLNSLEKDRYFIWTGFAIGLGMLAKYTVFIVAPVFIIYLLFFRRNYFSSKKFWLGLLLAMIIFSPVIIYNIKLYQAVEHFDFQISYLLGQKPEVWQSAPGKEEIGSLTDRLKNFIPNLINSNSWILLVFFALTIPAFLFFTTAKNTLSERSESKGYLLKDLKESLKSKELLIVSYIFLILLLLLIGPTQRFLTMLTPFFSINAALFLNFGCEKFLKNRKLIARALLTGFLAFEGFYSVNSQIIDYPVGKDPWNYSKVRLENYSWGYNELNDFFEKELRGKLPSFTFEAKYRFLEDIKARAFESAQNNGFESYPALVIYDGNILNAPQLWILDRRQIYHGWPTVNAEDYFSILRENGNDYFQKVGLKFHYFVMPTNKVPLKSPEKLTDFGANLEQQLIAREIEPTILKNRRNEVVFQIYKF